MVTRKLLERFLIFLPDGNREFTGNLDHIHINGVTLFQRKWLFDGAVQSLQVQKEKIFPNLPTVSGLVEMYGNMSVL